LEKCEDQQFFMLHLDFKLKEEGALHSNKIIWFFYFLIISLLNFYKFSLFKIIIILLLNMIGNIF